jgi:hypothetical protein
MKAKLILKLLCFCLLPFAFCLSAFAQGTAFTYQGRLNDGANPAGGSYDLRFTMYDSSGGPTVASGPLTNSATGVTNGLFTVTLDFGANFPGADRWLEIGVRTNGVGAFSTLTPRQWLTPTPYAIYAGAAGSAGAAGAVTGSFSGDVNGTQGATVVGSVGGYLAATVASGASAANAATSVAMPGTIVKRDGAGNFSAVTITGSFTGNGGGLTNLNVTTLNGLDAGGFWKTGGNAGTTPSTNFLGTTDNQPVELRAGNLRALRLEPGASGKGAPNIIGGSQINFVAGGVVGATIGGGGATNYSGSSYTNSVTADFGTVSGGANNTASGFGYGATVGGGIFNTASGAYYATVGGGLNNTASGGYSATVGGGYGNTASGSYATVGGGYGNTASGSYYATVPGGLNNLAGGQYSFAAGQRAKAINDGTFVWADSQNADFSSTSSDQFLIRAQGGVGIGKNNPASTLDVNGTVTAAAFSGDGTGLTSLNAGHLASGTIPSGVLSGTYSSAVTFNNAGNSFTGNGSGLTSLNAGNLASGTIPSGVLSGTYGNAVTFNNAGNSFAGNGAGLTSLNASNIASGTLADARYSTNVALLSGAQTFGGTKTFSSELAATGGVRVNNTNLWFKGDGNHGLGWYGNGKPFAGVSNSIDGPVLFGFTGGALATEQFGSEHIAVQWSATSVTVNGTFNNNSDRHAKQAFTTVTPAEILAKVSRLPLCEWSYKVDTATRHIGPMAQDFYAAFNVGTDEKHIAPIDEGGVALAAIQGLNEKVESGKQKAETRIKKLEVENAELQQRLATLEKIVLAQKSN